MYDSLAAFTLSRVPLNLSDAEDLSWKSLSITDATLQLNFQILTDSNIKLQNWSDGANLCIMRTYVGKYSQDEIFLGLLISCLIHNYKSINPTIDEIDTAWWHTFINIISYLLKALILWPQDNKNSESTEKRSNWKVALSLFTIQWQGWRMDIVRFV